MRPVLVTRAEPGASRTVERLRERGYTPVNAATAHIEHRRRAVELSGVAALAFTSPNGVDAFMRNSARRDLPVFAVGPATAAAARAAGFAQVTSADGDGAALARLILGAPPDGPVLHVGGAARAFALAETLAAAGLAADTLVLYDAVETGPLNEPAIEALRQGAVILIHSPLGARRFVAQLKAADLRAALGACPVAAISDKAAAPLAQAGAGSVAAAASPDEDALFELLEPLVDGAGR